MILRQTKFPSRLVRLQQGLTVFVYVIFVAERLR
nr:MAG TPA: hypothetical protein [Caudoviricetes sp.]